MADTQWDSIRLDGIYQTHTEESNIIFMKCKAASEVQKITAHAKNLPPDDTSHGPRLVNYIDKCAKARHHAFQQVAKTLCDNAEEPIQTNICTGHNNFLLRILKKGDTTPWSQLSPLSITRRMSSFKVSLYKDLKDMSLSSSDSDPNMEEDDSTELNDELDRVQRNIENAQTESDKKCDRISDSEDTPKRQTRHKSTPHPRGRGQSPPDLPTSQSDSDDDINGPPSALNKTLVPETPTCWKNPDNPEQPQQSVQETPMQTSKKYSNRMEDEL